MEKWKLGIIGLLLLGLVGYGVSQQKSAGDAPTFAGNSLVDSTGNTAQTPPAENKVAGFIGQNLGGDKLPAWSNLGPWDNTKSAIAIDSLKGKPALVEFFRINCSHCQEAAPFLEMLYKRYQPRGLKMVAVQTPGDYKDPENEETQWPKVQAWVKAAGITYPVAMDKNSAYFQGKLKGTTYPTTMITDANGKVVEAHTGYDTAKAVNLAVELEKLLPGAGTPRQRAQDLAKFLRPIMYGNAPVSAAIEKSLVDDLEQRLKGKV